MASSICLDIFSEKLKEDFYFSILLESKRSQDSHFIRRRKKGTQTYPCVLGNDT